MNFNLCVDLSVTRVYISVSISFVIEFSMGVAKQNETCNTIYCQVVQCTFVNMCEITCN